MTENHPERDPLEMLAAEYMERLREGERPSIEDYATRHPELAEEIRELFPTIAVTERLKAKQARSSGGLASLGAARLERLGDFRIIREIGRGGMGVVFEAEQESLGRRVAVKVLPRQVLLDETHLKRFEREARIAANLHHTHIVEIFGVGEQDGFHYYVMQYIRGAGLDAIISRLAHWVRSPGNRPPGAAEASAENVADSVARRLLGEDVGRVPGPHYWQSVARIGLQAAEALDYAHSQGTLHRDIKPANLLVDPQGTVWLADFGLAKAARSEDISASRDLVGTLRYMAPEQFGGQTDHRSDLYSLGLTLYELLALQAAYTESDQTRLMQRIAQGPPPPPGDLTRPIPRDLETIILKAVSHDPQHRYASAGAMADDLRNFLADRPIQARRPSPVERLGRWCRHNRALAALTGTTAILLVIVAATASIAYVRTRHALLGEAQSRARAEATAGLAREALDRMFERLSPSRIRVSAQPPAADEAIGAPGPVVLSKPTAALLEEMLPFYDRLAQQTGQDDRLLAGTAEANRRVGAIRQRLGQSEEAVKAYRRAIEVLEGLLGRAPGSRELRLQLAQTQNELGRIWTAQRRFAEAREAYLKAQLLLETDGASASAPEELRFELARTYYLLGNEERPLPASTRREDDRPAHPPEDRRESLAHAVALLSELSAVSARPEYQHLLALCYLEGATAREGGDRPVKGGGERAIDILERLVQSVPGDLDYAFDLSEAYARIQVPRPPIAPETRNLIEDRFSKGLALLDTLVARNPDIPDFLAARARLRGKLGAYYRQVEQWPEAEARFHQAIADQKELVKQFPTAPYYQVWMANFSIALADALIRQNRATEARTELEQTLASLERVLEKSPEIPRPYDLLALGYSKLAAAARQTGEKEKADEATRKAEQERAAARRAP